MRTVKPIQSTLSDAELVQSYRINQQQDVLAQLFLRYHDLIYGTCIKYLADQEAAKDAAMSIYEELVEKLKAHQVENFKSWLYVVTRNHCLMILRKQKVRHIELQSDDMQSEDFWHLDNVHQKELRLQALEQCMEHLNNDQKQTVHLFYIENRCYKEICEVTGYDWNKVRSLIQNGRRNLKLCMEKNG